MIQHMGIGKLLSLASDSGSNSYHYLELSPVTRNSTFFERRFFFMNFNISFQVRFSLHKDGNNFMIKLVREIREKL